MNTKDNTIRALEMIQSIISRMANNSFALKGWAVTLVVGIFALSSKDTEKIFGLFAFAPVILFWFLDAFYLRKERQYRNLYNWTRKQPEDNIDFDMNVERSELKSKDVNYCNCLFSKSELFFYLPLGLLTLLIIILSFL